MVVTATVQRVRTRWEAETKKKQLKGLKAYRSSKQQRLQKVIDTLGEDHPLMQRKILIDVYQQEIEEIDKSISHGSRIKDNCTPSQWATGMLVLEIRFVMCVVSEWQDKDVIWW
jgi:flagellar biosynthesis chaperone FliJ